MPDFVVTWGAKGSAEFGDEFVWDEKYTIHRFCFVDGMFDRR
jgi:hypothetical protein